MKKEKRHSNMAARWIALVLTSIIALSLAACGSSNTSDTDEGSNQADYEETYTSGEVTLSASQAFLQEGIWFYLYDSTYPKKNTEIILVLVFDGEGNVTTYRCAYSTDFTTITLSDIEGLSDEEIIELAKKSDEEVFEDWRERTRSRFSISYSEYEEYYTDMTAFIESLEYEEPEPLPYSLCLATDGTGNNVVCEYIYLDVTVDKKIEYLNASLMGETSYYEYKEYAQELGGWEAYFEETVSIDNSYKFCDGSNLDYELEYEVYNSTYIGYKYSPYYLMTRNTDEQTSYTYILDEIGTEGVEVN